MASYGCLFKEGECVVLFFIQTAEYWSRERRGTKWLSTSLQCRCSHDIFAGQSNVQEPRGLALQAALQDSGQSSFQASSQCPT